ncbi:putative sensor-like histidine kinase [compost metagenome]
MENYEQTVQLQQELDYLADYVGLLNMRYKCQVHLEAEIEEPLRSMQIPKLSLQPLIENSVFHGILPNKTPEGYIKVHVFTDSVINHIVIEVSDDGVGLEEAALGTLQLHLLREESTENIGLQNVWMRMKLLFGNAAQILLLSPPEEGLTIRITLPLETVLVKEEHHESL